MTVTSMYFTWENCGKNYGVNCLVKESLLQIIIDYMGYIKDI